jgi:hypothetical protein
MRTEILKQVSNTFWTLSTVLLFWKTHSVNWICFHPQMKRWEASTHRLISRHNIRAVHKCTLINSVTSLAYRYSVRLHCEDRTSLFPIWIMHHHSPQDGKHFQVNTSTVCLIWSFSICAHTSFCYKMKLKLISCVHQRAEIDYVMSACNLFALTSR